MARTSFSLDEKRRVLEHLRTSGRVRETIARFYPQLPAEAYDARRRLVLSWRRNAREILAGASTRQGAARRRMRKPKTPRPQPPQPRGLADAQELQDEPSPGRNEHELPEFEPILLKRGRPKTSATHSVQDDTQNEGRDQNLGNVDEIQDDVQDQDQYQDQDLEGGIQDLITRAVEQSVQPEEVQAQAEDSDVGTGLGSGPGSGAGKGDSDGDSEDSTTAATSTAAAPTAVAGQRRPKRSSFSLDEKRRVLEHLTACKNVRETITTFYPDLPPEEFNTRRRTIWRWRTCAEQIVAGCADDKASARKKMRPRGIVCQRGPKPAVGPQDVVDRLLTSVNKSEQRALKRKSRQPALRPAPPPPGPLAERQMDAIVFSALGLPPTTQFRPIQPAPATSTSSATAAASAESASMHPLQRGEVTFAIRRR